MQKRIGPRQQAILAYVEHNPGESILSIDRETNYHTPHSHTVTYDAVHRLHRRGLVVLRQRSGRYAVESAK